MELKEILLIGFLSPLFIISLKFFMEQCYIRIKIWILNNPILLIVVIGLLFFGAILYQTLPVFNSNSVWKIDLKDKESVPAYLTLFVTAITAVYLYRTLNEQKETSYEQKRANLKSEFENRFFKLMDYHRENVHLLEARNPNSTSEEYHRGSSVFTVLYYQIDNLLKEYFENKYKGVDIQTLTIQQKQDAIDFIYQCLFYGAGIRGILVLTETFSKKGYNFSLELSYIPSFIKPSNYSPNEKFYSGNIRRLGHYFRNIYQAIQYIEQQTFLSYKEKYDYVAFYRAQMSAFEQAVFFFNSLSDLGKNWEYKNYNECRINGKEQSVFNKLLITKYDLIRNIYNNNGFVIAGVRISDFYPLLNLEREEELCKYGNLPFKDKSVEICRTCYNVTYLGYELDNEKAINDCDTYATNYTDSKSIKCNEDNCISIKILEEFEKNHIPPNS